MVQTDFAFENTLPHGLPRSAVCRVGSWPFRASRYTSGPWPRKKKHPVSGVSSMETWCLCAEHYQIERILLTSLDLFVVRMGSLLDPFSMFDNT